ncbi:MAG TPA: type II toxin-antitoxin system MqsA family antitoxin [Polyangiaceae bacterium]|nr:type II toxin-antitoxin system MqsA family antitoxin [Polyangiaceae bacterium]
MGDQGGRADVCRIPGECTMTDREELTREELSRALTRTQRKRIMAGKLEPGDVAALRRFVCLTQERFAEALGISVHTLRNWEQDRVQPDGPGLALLRIAARHPRIVRENVTSAA